MAMNGRLAGLFAALALALAPSHGAMAQAAQEAGGEQSLVTLVTDAPPPAAEREGLKVYRRALADAQKSGAKALRRHRAALREVLDEAPAAYPKYEVEGQDWTVRTFALAETILLMAAAGKSAKEGGEPIRLIVQPNLYPEVALLLGSEAVERGDYADAIAQMDRGLALQPAHGGLVVEKASALSAQGRAAEAYALVEGALRSGDLGVVPYVPILLRQKGFALIELDRLDEAKAAYEAALTLEPESKLAKSQLAYIAGLQKGAPQDEPRLQPSEPPPNAN